MKVTIAALASLAAFSAILAFAQGQSDEPTRQEIAEAYRSKSGGFATLIPHHEWEHWRIRQIRGWKLHFKQISRKQSAGVRTLRYDVVAKRNQSCAKYQITDTMPGTLPPNPHMPMPIVVVEPGGVTECR